MHPPAPGLSLLWGENTYQTFVDDKNAQLYPRVIHGSWTKVYDELMRENDAGAGIYFTPNATDGTGRKAENIVEIRSWFVDIDGIPAENVKRGVIRRLLEHQLSPSAIVETRAGLHCYWYAVPGAEVDLELFKRVEEGVIGFWGGDPSAKDVSRVLRVPGFRHLKRAKDAPPPDPFIITTVYEAHDALYLAEEMLEAFPPAEKRYQPRHDRSLRVDSADSWDQVVVALDRWRAIPSARHRVMTIACGVAYKFGVSEAQAVADMLGIVTGWDTGRDMATELKRTARWAYQRATPATVKALRNEGVDVPKLRAPA